MIERACPRCGWTLEFAEPDEGAALVCVNCAAVLLFTEDRELRLATEYELPTLMARPDIAGMVAAVNDEEDEP